MPGTTVFFSKLGALALAVMFVAGGLLVRLAGAEARRTILVLDAAGVVLIASAGLAFTRLRGHERELRDAMTGIENQTIVLEHQATRLGNNEREIRALNQALEARVEQRTRDLAQANQALEAANQAKSEFLANMSHELRTPMTAVLGYADLLLDPGLTAAERSEHVFTIRKNGEHLLIVINDILDLSKIEAGRMTVERIPCSPSLILGDVVSLLHLRAASKGLALGVRYETPVPEIIRSDPTRLRQILLNLVGNAIKFTATGSVQLVVACDVARGQIAFEIADTGIGLSREHQDRLFQPFTQADASTTRLFGGSGLGLAICHRLAAMLGGEIRVESLLGRGSSFVLTLDTGPLSGVRMLAAPAPLRTPTLAAARAAPARVAGSVLLAEDSSANQTLIATFLRLAGAAVSIVENGRLAVDTALAAESAGRGFDVILMDMQMPVLDGYGATRALRQSGYRRPIIALTAHAMDGDRDKCLAAGCDDYLTKPLERGALIARVALTLERARAATPAPGSAPSGGDDPAPASARHAIAGAAEALLFSELAEDPDIAALIPDFLQHLADSMGELGEAVESDDRARASMIVHQLKGSAGGYGFPTITEAAARLERARQEGLPPDAQSEALRSLVSLCLRARAPRATAAGAPSPASPARAPRFDRPAESA